MLWSSHQVLWTQIMLGARLCGVQARLVVVVFEVPEHGGNTSILENKYDDPVASRISLVQYNNRSRYMLTGYFYRLQYPSFESTNLVMVLHDEIILF